jgi:hypothetical protein
MNVGLPQTLERDVMRAEEPDWLRLWEHQGWVPSGEPVVCGWSPDGDPVHRHMLERTASASWAPSIPWIEPCVEREPSRALGAQPDTAAVPPATGARRRFASVAWLSAQRQGQHEPQLES